MPEIYDEQDEHDGGCWWPGCAAREVNLEGLCSGHVEAESKDNSGVLVQPWAEWGSLQVCRARGCTRRRDTADGVCVVHDEPQFACLLGPVIRAKPRQDPTQPPIDALVALIDGGIHVDALRAAIEGGLDLEAIRELHRGGPPMDWIERWINSQPGHGGTPDKDSDT